MGAVLSSVLLIATSLATASGTATAQSAGMRTDAGFQLSDPTIASYFHQHGGDAAIGNAISNPMQLLGRRVQLFERVPLEVRADGSVGPLSLLEGDLLSLTAVAGRGMMPDPILLARVPDPGIARYHQLASAYLDSAAPDTWNGEPVRFNSRFRSAVHCSDMTVVAACDAVAAFDAATDLWGLPIGTPFADPRNANYVYLRFQRGVMVYSSAASDTQWLLLGKLFKQILLGTGLPDDALTQIEASPNLARFYAQYDPLAPDSVARPGDVLGTSLSGAFTASGAAPLASVTPAAATPLLDARFGVADGFEDSGLMAELHGGWERVVIPWDEVQPDGPGDFSHLGMTLPADRLGTEISRGIHVAAVLQFTPPWAQLDPVAGQRSVPKNLDLPYDDPRNYWGRFVYETVRHYAGQIDEWIIWNEPDFRPDDPGGSAYTWAGTDGQFARLLAVAYQAAKKANPNAVVSFPATSYWVDETSSPRRAPFYERLLRILTSDPLAAEHGLYHDAVALNLYRSPDDVYRVHSVFAAIQHRYGVDKPIWLTEMNAMPVNDPLSTCADHQITAGFKVTLDQQAAYAVQSFALAAAAGYQHVEFYNMTDDPTCQYPSWGLVRADGTRRPAAGAIRTALSYFSHFTSVQFVPLVRRQQAWPAWPDTPSSFLPNWQVYQVVFDRPQNQRVTALWNADGSPLRVRIPKNGASARVVDSHGIEHSAREEAGSWVVDLPPATARAQGDDSNRDPEGYHVIGGDPVLLVEDSVNLTAPVISPTPITT